MIIRNLTIAFLLCFSSVFAHASAPRLIVQIVVDQLRGDLLTQYQNDFGTDGFNYLLNHAINYENAHHPHALSVTCVGHATISTGSTPAMHGIIANDWYDPQTKKLVYCTEDPQSPLLANVRGKNTGTGQSPKNIMASTFSDELMLAERGRSFGVSLKDRSAITLGGHAGKAFWFDKEHGGFITSQYYFDKTPEWINQWNTAYHPTNETWSLLNPINTYHYAKQPSTKRDFPGYGEQFPHHLGEPSSKNYYTYLAMSPIADRLTEQFAVRLIEQEKLGKSQDKTDYLGISFSAVDVIGHQYGPNSLESEDNLRQLDKTIAALLKSIDQQVGLNNTLIILTADHGMTDSPDWLKQHHITPTEGLNINQLQKVMTELLATRYQLPKNAIEFIKPPYVYLNHELIAAKGLNLSEVSLYLASMLQHQPNLYNVYTLPLTNTQNDWLSHKVSKMAQPDRAGDLFLVPYPHQDITDSNVVYTTHGSPWNYDSYVPLLFVNPGFKTMHITRPVYSTDIAPTLSSILKIKAPSASIGKPLKELTNN